MKIFGALGGIIVAITSVPVLAAKEISVPSAEVPVEIVPSNVAPACKSKPQKTQILYDLCQDQRRLLQDAQRRAQAAGKTVLVSYGADWCIWCHVFDAHIHGIYGRFTYQTPDGPWAMREADRAGNASEAAALKSFVAENFVILNIAQESGQSGTGVLTKTGADLRADGGLPFIFALDSDGQFAGAIASAEVEIRRDGDDPYRGYDRTKLLAALKSLVKSKP